jgi:hypothetical protein
MGQRDLRRLLIIGASAVVSWARKRSAPEGSWLARMLLRKPPMLVVVVLANKIARIGENSDNPAFTDSIYNFLDTVPDGPIQDADCLAICGYMLGESGDFERAGEIYERCLHSPSTSRDQVFELMVEYLALSVNAQETDRAIAVASTLLADLCQFGLFSPEYKSAFLIPAKARLPDSLIKQVDQETKRIVSGWLDGARL